jgi:hypothetical protein
MNEVCSLHASFAESLEAQGRMLSEIHTALLGSMDGKKGLIHEVQENSAWIKEKNVAIKNIISKIIIAVSAAAIVGGGAMSLVERVLK